MRWGLLYVVRFSLQQSWSMTTGLDWGSPWGWHWGTGSNVGISSLPAWILKGLMYWQCLQPEFKLAKGRLEKNQEITSLLMDFFCFTFLNSHWVEHGEAHACITEDNLTTLISPSTVWILQRNLKLPSLVANAFGWGISPPLMVFWGGKSEDPQSFRIQRHCNVDSLPWCWDLNFSLNPHISCYRETHSSSFSGLMYTWVCVCECTYMCVQMCVHG